MSEEFEHVALIGLGLIASSIAWRLREGDNRPKITGFARSEATRNRARELGFCDEVADNMTDAIKDADLVLLCTPVGAMGAVMQEIAPHLRQGAVISDVGSTKKSVIEAVLPELPEHAELIPAHPLAGTEKSGPDAGFAALFENRWVILTPQDPNSPNVAKLTRFWNELGSEVDIMDPDHHDLVLAVVSHVPHLIAYTMVGVADDLERVSESEVIKYSASGFRDFTRIAASDPVMWRDVFLANKESALEILGRFTEELFALQRAIRMGDGDLLKDYFTRTRHIRRSIIEQGQDTDVPDFGRNLALSQKVDTKENNQ